MREILRELQEWVERGDQVALATVVGVRRSAPRPPGAKMAINHRGEIAGSVSGGCVEAAVVTAAEKVLKGKPAQLLSFGIADAEAWEVGLPCGGEIDVWVERYQASALVKAAASGRRMAEVTLLEGARPGAKMTIAPGGGCQGTLGAPELDDEAARLAGGLMWSEVSERHGALFVDVVAPPRRERFPDAEEVIAAWPEQAFEHLGGIDPATSIVVLTHDPKLDDDALLLALRSTARFVGAMGSRRAQATRRERLSAAGLVEEELGRLAAPIGLDLGAVDRDETAVSIIAEIVAARHNRDGGRLKFAQGRIHDIGVELG